MIGENPKFVGENMSFILHWCVGEGESSDVIPAFTCIPLKYITL